MDVHQNAKTTPNGRRLMIQRLAEGWTISATAAARSASRQDRAQMAGPACPGRRGRPARPLVAAAPQPDPARRSGGGRDHRSSAASACPDPRSPAGSAGRSPPSAWSCAGVGLGRLAALDPKPEIVRYQRDQPGELIHLDIKKLGRIDGIGHRITGDRRGRKRGIGWDFLHVCVDDASRLAYTEILPDERKESAVAFLERAFAWFATLGVTVERVMTDNGSAYRSHRFRQALAAGLKHKRTRPYTPQTNGKAERFIQTSLREWAYRQAFASSAARAASHAPLAARLQLLIRTHISLCC